MRESMPRCISKYAWMGGMKQALAKKDIILELERERVEQLHEGRMIVNRRVLTLSPCALLA